jgi:type III secretion protein T
MFIVELGAAIITRYVPQLNVFILMMPIKAGIAALLMVYYVTYISRYLMDSFLKFGDSFQVLESVFK